MEKKWGHQLSTKNPGTRHNIKSWEIPTRIRIGYNSPTINNNNKPLGIFFNIWNLHTYSISCTKINLIWNFNFLFWGVLNKNSTLACSTCQVWITVWVRIWNWNKSGFQIINFNWVLSYDCGSHFYFSRSWNPNFQSLYFRWFQISYCWTTHWVCS